jgi:hypothetical protein
VHVADPAAKTASERASTTSGLENFNRPPPSGFGCRRPHWPGRSQEGRYSLVTVFLLELSVCAAIHNAVRHDQIRSATTAERSVRIGCRPQPITVGSDAESVSQRTDPEYLGG